MALFLFNKIGLFFVKKVTKKLFWVLTFGLIWGKLDVTYKKRRKICLVVVIVEAAELILIY